MYVIPMEKKVNKISLLVVKCLIANRSLVLVSCQTTASFIIVKLALQKIELRQASLRGISEESTLILINYFSQSETRIGEPGKSAQKRLNSVKPSNYHLPRPSLGMLPDKTVCCLQDKAP